MNATFWKQRHGKREEGFTLIEVTIASGLIAFEILAVIAMFGTSTKATTFAKRLTTATSLAQSRVETAKNTPFVKLSTPVKVQTTPAILESIVGSGLVSWFDRNLVPLTSAAGAVYTRTATIGDFTKDRYDPTVIPGIKKITVVVSWNDDSGNTHSTTLVSGVSQY